MSGESVQDQILTAANLVVRSRIFLEAWWLSRGEQGRHQYNDFWDEYWEFWRFNEEALLSAFAVHICGLFDPPHNGTINLRNLMNNLTGNYKNCALSSQFKRAIDIARKVILLRSNLWAHRSGRIGYTEAFKKANVTADELHELTVLALEIVNFMLRSTELTEREFSTLPINTLRRMASHSASL